MQPRIQKIEKPTRFTNQTKMERKGKERKLKTERKNLRNNKRAEKTM